MSKKGATSLGHPHVKDFIEFKEIVGDRAIAKQTIPSPNQLFNAGIRNKDIYPEIEDYANDIIKAYRDAIKAFYDAGCRYQQLDEVYIAGLNAPEIPFNDSDYSRVKLIDLALRVAKIAPTLFAKENVDGFFLEYDDDRSGDFKPLEYIPNGGAHAVVRVFTSKHVSRLGWQ